MNSRLRILVSIVALCGAASVWAGDAGPVKGQFYVHPMMTYYDPPGELGFDEASTGPGLALGWSFVENWALELEYDTHQPDLKSPPGGKGKIESAGINIMYLIHGPRLFTPFLTVGGGRGSYERDDYQPNDGQTSTQNEYNFGVGTYIGTSKRLAFRADVRGKYVNDVHKMQPWAAVGVVFKFGRIEEPPAPVVVPAVVDSDGDGVPDGSDACPNTPTGVKVDSRGCPLDSDGDGVPDYLDKCPNTPAGTKVDSSGCPIVAATTFDLTVEFAFNSAEINDLSFRELRRAMTFMRDNPQTKAVVEGHTDSVGSAAFNQTLSERRAAAVKDVLVKSDIDANRLTTVGYGLTKPVASNDTEEGRAKNRRVSIVVTGQ